MALPINTLVGDKVDNFRKLIYNLDCLYEYGSRLATELWAKEEG